MFADKCVSDAPEFSRRLLLSNACVQTTDDSDCYATAACTWVERCRRIDWIRDVDVHALGNAKRGVVELEVARQHTHNDCRLGIQSQGSADRMRIASHMRAPESIR